MDWRPILAGEYEVLALLAGPLTTCAVGWLLRQAQLHLRDARTRAYVARLVAWAQQAIPDKSERYVQVAALLSARFPALKAADVEVLIESEVHALKSYQPSAVSNQPATPGTAPADSQRSPASAGPDPGGAAATVARSLNSLPSSLTPTAVSAPAPTAAVSAPAPTAAGTAMVPAQG